MSDIDKMSQHRVATVEPWHITKEEFRPERNEISESLFSLANRGGGIGPEITPGCLLNANPHLLFNVASMRGKE
jgi:hypothetical protein